MAKIVIQHDRDPCIGIVLEYSPGGPDRAMGWYGTCTQCGRIMHRWKQDRAIEDAQRHVDSH